MVWGRGRGGGDAGEGGCPGGGGAGPAAAAAAGPGSSGGVVPGRYCGRGAASGGVEALAPGGTPGATAAPAPLVLRLFLGWVDAGVRLSEWGEDVANGSRPASPQGWLRVRGNRQCDKVQNKGRSNLVFGGGLPFCFPALRPFLAFFFSIEVWC